MGLLSECFGTVLTPERLLARVRPQVDLDVGLVQERPVALGAVVHHLPVRVVVVRPVRAVRARPRGPIQSAAATATVVHLWPDLLRRRLDGPRTGHVAQPSVQALVGGGRHVVHRGLGGVGHRVAAVRAHEVVRGVDLDDVAVVAIVGASVGEPVLQDGVGGRGRLAKGAFPLLQLRDFSGQISRGLGVQVPRQQALQGGRGRVQVGLLRHHRVEAGEAQGHDRRGRGRWALAVIRWDVEA